MDEVADLLNRAAGKNTWDARQARSILGRGGALVKLGERWFTTRSRLGHLMAQGRLSGTDGYAGKTATAATVQRMVLDSRVYTAERFKAQVLALVCATPDIDVAAYNDPYLGDTPAGTVRTAEACTALRAWDDTDNSVGFWAIGTNLSYDHATHTLSAAGSGSGTVTGVGLVQPAAGITVTSNTSNPIISAGTFTLTAVAFAKRAQV